MILDLKFRSGLLSLLCGFFALGTASLCFAEEGKTEMSQADSINRANQHLSFGNRYLKSKQYEDAETQFLKSFGYNSKRAATARLLGKLYNETEKYEDAIQWYQKAIEIDPIIKYTRGVHKVLGSIYEILEQPGKAVGSYEALLALDLELEKKIKEALLDPESEKKIKEALLAFDLKSKDMNKLEVEKNKLEKERIQTYHKLVSLNVETQDYERALDYAKKWGELAPDEPEVRDMIGKLHLQTGGEDEALVEMEKVLEINPDDYATLEKLAGMYERRGDDDKAFDAFEKLYQNDGSSVFFLEETIKLGKKIGKSKSWIVNRLEKLYAMQPDNLGMIEELAELTGSLKWVDKGLKQDPQNGRYPYMRGDHYFHRWENSSAKQDSVNALTWYRRALKDPMWKGNANAMIQTLDPPLTEEEKKRRDFFEGSKQKKEEKEEVETEGKK